jgi:hypothetical protein
MLLNETGPDPNAIARRKAYNQTRSEVGTGLLKKDFEISFGMSKCKVLSHKCVKGCRQAR